MKTINANNPSGFNRNISLNKNPECNVKPWPYSFCCFGNPMLPASLAGALHYKKAARG